MSWLNLEGKTVVVTGGASLAAWYNV